MVGEAASTTVRRSGTSGAQGARSSSECWQLVGCDGGVWSATEKSKLSGLMLDLTLKGRKRFGASGSTSVVGDHSCIHASNKGHNVVGGVCAGWSARRVHRNSSCGVCTKKVGVGEGSGCSSGLEVNRHGVVSHVTSSSRSGSGSGCRIKVSDRNSYHVKLHVGLRFATL